MENEQEITSQTHINLLSQKPRTSRLAFMSMVFGILGPFFFGAMWTVSFLSFHDLVIASPRIASLFSCGLAWILGLVLGMKSLKKIDSSEGQLVGKGFAFIGIFISLVWMVVIFAALLLPALYYVNS